MNDVSLRRLAIFLFVAQILLVIASIPAHIPHVDEAWLGEQAYRLNEKGYPHSYIIQGVSGEEKYLAMRHWLFIATESRVISVLGFSQFTLQLFPLVCGSILLFLLGRYARQTLVPDAAMLAMSLCLLIPQYFFYYKTARPEIPVTMLGFASFVVLSRSFAKHNLPAVIAAGILAGAATGMHFHGGIFVAAGAVLLLIRKRFLHAVVFCAAAGLVLLPFIMELTAHWDAFRQQTGSATYSRRTSLSPLSLLENLLREHQRLFRKPMIIFVTVMTIAALAVRWRKHSDEMRKLRWYLCALIIALGMIAEDKTDKYVTYFSPFYAIIIAEFLLQYKPKELHRFVKPVLAVVITAFFLNGIVYQIQDVFFRKTPDIVEYHRNIGQSIPDGATCIAPIFFVFDEVKRLKVVSNYSAGLVEGQRLSEEKFAGYCDRAKVQYAVFTKYSDPFDVVPKFMSGEFTGDSLFALTARGSDYVVVRRK